MYYALYPRFLNLQSKNIKYYCLATVDVFYGISFRLNSNVNLAKIIIIMLNYSA